MPYGELATGIRPAGRPTLRIKNVFKRDQKTGNVNPTGWEAVAADRSCWRLAVKARISGGSRPSDKRGGGHPDPEIRGGPGLQRNFFGPSGLILVEK